MAYDKTKVTIDLEEYQQMKDDIKTFKGTDEGQLLLAHKTVIASLAQLENMNGFDVRKVDNVRHQLLHLGYQFYISKSATEYGLSAEHIKIEKIKKT